MTTQISTQEYAWLSEQVYNVKRNDNSQFDIAELGKGWSEERYIKNGRNDPEFSAGVYKKGNEVVIAITGSNSKEDYTHLNIPAGMGYTTKQVLDAMVLVVKTIRKYPDANITFTGHSLGGGLASLMGVFFDKETVVFDEAPFENTATNPATMFYFACYLRDKWGGVTNLPKEFIDYCNSSGIGDAWQNLGNILRNKSINFF